MCRVDLKNDWTTEGLFKGKQDPSEFNWQRVARIGHGVVILKHRVSKGRDRPVTVQRFIMRRVYDVWWLKHRTTKKAGAKTVVWTFKSKINSRKHG